MLTEIGMRKMKAQVIKAATANDAEWNAIIQEAVKKINRLALSRFPSA